MWDAILWGSVGASGIGIAWGLDAWARTTGRSRLLALLGLLPVLVYAVVMLALYGWIDAETPLMILSEVRRTERVAFRLASACGGMASAIVIAIMLRWSFTDRGRGEGVDPTALGLGAGLGLLGIGGGMLTWWLLAARATPDWLLLLSAGVLLAATLPGLILRGPTPEETLDRRVRFTAFSALSGALLALRFAGHMAELSEHPWWTLARPRLYDAATAALIEGLAWGLVPALVALGTLLPRLGELRARHALPVGAAAAGALAMASPILASIAIQATHEPLLDFAPVAAGVNLPTHDAAYGSPHHGCYWRLDASGGALVPSQTALTPGGCEGLDPAEAEAFIAPVSATLADLPAPVDAAFDTDTLTLLIRTERAAPYPYRLVPIAHAPQGQPMAGRSLQEIVDRCHGDAAPCNLEPWAAAVVEGPE